MFKFLTKTRGSSKQSNWFVSPGLNNVSETLLISDTGQCLCCLSPEGLMIINALAKEKDQFLRMIFLARNAMKEEKGERGLSTTT